MGFHPDSTSRTSPLRRALTALNARRGHPAAAAVRRASREIVERLEGRTLFAVVSAGDTAFYFNGTNSYKIQVTGSGAFTFTAAVRPATGDGIRLEDVPMTVTHADRTRTDYNGGYRTEVGTLPGGGTPPPLPIFDIYSIYSSNTSSDTSLSITQYDITTDSAFSNPFGGDGGSFRTQMVDAGQRRPFSLSPDEGGVFIGGRANAGTTKGVTVVYSLQKNVSIATSPGVTLKSGKTFQPGIFITGVNDKPASVNNLFIAGVITGRVLVTGSVNTFYAGNILTGDIAAGNLGTFDADTNPQGTGIGAQNFRIGGDLRNLIVTGGIGTVDGAPNAFLPGTDLSIGGRVQQIKTGVEFRGSLDVGGATGSYTNGSDLTELESRDVTNVADDVVGDAFDNFQLVNLGATNNDSFDTPQILGSYKSDTTKAKGQVTISGSIDNGTRYNDNADYYGVPLDAGQVITVQLTSADGLTYLGVYDPDGRQIATDRSNQNNALFQGQSIQITATTAGLYRVAALPVTPATRVALDRLYTLSVNKLGDIGIGGLESLGDVYFSNPTLGFRVRNADLGAILARDELYGADASDLGVTARDATLGNPIITDRGNIRSVYANTSISILRTGTIGRIPNIVAAQNVGRIQSDGFLYFNDTGLNISTGQPSSNLTIGGSYQVIQAAADFAANLSADVGIGVIRAGSVGQTIRGFPGYFGTNADGKGNDGYIGLIDVANDLGTFTYGGPAISSGGGSSSNVKYMRVGGTAYRDAFTGEGEAVAIQPNDTAVTIIDDSGAAMLISPIIGEDFDNTPDTTTGGNGTDTTTGSDVDDTVIGSNGTNPIGTNPNIPNPIGTVDTTGDDTNGDGIPDDFDGDGLPDGTDTRPRTASGRLIGGFLTIGAYPTRNGGSVVYRVTAADYLTGTAARSVGVEINTTGTGPNPSGDIGELITTGNTAAVVQGATIFDKKGNVVFQPSKQTGLSQADTGTNLEVIASGITTNIFDIHSATGTADYTNIFNGTDGEIVNVTAGSVGTLEANYLGVSRNVAGVQLDGVANAGTTAQNVYPFNNAKNLIDVGNAISIRSRGPLGNIYATNIQLLEANADDRNTKGVFEGIVAPVVATNSIFRTDIGEGLATSGSGEVGGGGLYSQNTLGLISNENGGGDLRGDVIAYAYIEGIRLNAGGSIIDSDVLASGSGTGTVFGGTTDTTVGFTVGQEVNSFLVNASANPADQGIGDVRVLGTGGIINSSFRGVNMGTTTVAPSGFGVLNSTFLSSGGATMRGLIAGGLGIRNTQYIGGAFVGDVVATGGGGLIDLNKLSTSVRGSDTGYYDSSTGISFNAANDVYRFFQTTSDDGTIVGKTNSGIIADSTIVASRSISSVRAFEFRSFGLQSLSPSDEAFPNTINFANSIGAIAAKRNIDGLRVVGGEIGSITAGASISHFQLQARARVGSINVKKNVLGTAHFNVTDEGSIGTFGVNGYMNGTIFAQQGIDSLVIDGNVRSARDQGGIYTAGSIQLLKIGGDVLDGAYIRAKRSIKSLTINGDLESGAVVRATRISKQTIRGRKDGTIQLS